MVAISVIYKKILKQNNIIKIYSKSFMFKNKTTKNGIEGILIKYPDGVKISFYSKVQVCKDGYVMRFLLPESEDTVGFRTCEYIYLEATPDTSDKAIKRPYHPISLDTDRGFVDIMIKVYPKEESNLNFGLFSNLLNSLEVY